MIEIMRKGALLGTEKQSGKGKKGAKQARVFYSILIFLLVPTGVTPYMKLMGLSPDEMLEALQAAATKGEGGSLMTTAEATETFIAYRTRRFVESLFIIL